jgi:Mn2+/Fe2+ NRAMP family transporter
MSHRYWTWERLTMAIAAFNLIFIPVALMAHPHWDAVGRALLVWKPLPGGLTKDTLLIVLADIGATVTPWMIFFQQSATVDKGLTRPDIPFGRIDTIIGGVLAAAAAIAVLLATAPLFALHMTAANYQAAEFAQALEPVIGHAGAALFALGIVEAGIVAAVTISTSSAYAFGEVAGLPHSLNIPFKEGKSFYGVLFACAAVVGGHRPDSEPPAGLCGSRSQRDRRASHAARSRVPVHAGERQRNYGRSGKSALGQYSCRNYRPSADRCRNSVRHQRHSS